MNNAAGRLLKLLKYLQDQPHGSCVALARFLGISSGHRSLLRLHQNLFEECELLVAQIEQFRDNQRKHQLFQEYVSEIQQAILGFQLNLREEKYSASTSEIALITLQYIGVDLPEEPPVESHVAQLNKQVHVLEEILAGVKGGNDIVWIRDILESIHDGLSGFVICGQRALHKPFNAVVGTILANHARAAETATKQPALWNCLVAVVRTMYRSTGTEFLSAEAISALAAFIPETAMSIASQHLQKARSSAPPPAPTSAPPLQRPATPPPTLPPPQVSATAAPA